MIDLVSQEVTIWPWRSRYATIFMDGDDATIGDDNATIDDDDATIDDGDASDDANAHTARGIGEGSC